MHSPPSFLEACWSVVIALAPWLLLGALVAGLLHVLLPPGFVNRQLSGRCSVLKAVLLGLPLPLCSCGVIPAALGLRRDGADRGATVGFLISTPQTGVDSILVSAAFLGWPFALFKVAAAAITGLLGGGLTQRQALGEVDERQDPAAQYQAPRTLPGMAEHSMSILRSIWHWIVLGVLISAAISCFVPSQSLSTLGSLGSMLAMLIIAVPLYVCATGSVPIAAALVASGMPTGSALVFLMAGPATNLATIGAVHKALGGRTLTLYLGTIISGSMAAGLLFDWLLPATLTPLGQHHHTVHWWELLSALLMCGLLARFAGEELQSWRRRKLNNAQPGQSLRISVEGMTCNGCRNRLEQALLNTAGVSDVAVVLEPGSAQVWGSLDETSLRKAIESAGYRALEMLSEPS
ncbi:MAG: hypothetical protein CMP23_15575 [Rickettsiales bacterium]|nr:hypothetical protein [Rickettsiales bacterium]